MTEDVWPLGLAGHAGTSRVIGRNFEIWSHVGRGQKSS